jgi:hypothetical protein
MPISLYYDFSNATNEYGVDHLSLLPLAVWYLKQIYKEKKYLRLCPLCGKPFVAKTAGMLTFCSDECKRESVRLNKKRFDEHCENCSKFYRVTLNDKYNYWLKNFVVKDASIRAVKQAVRVGFLLTFNPILRSIHVRFKYI